MYTHTHTHTQTQHRSFLKAVGSVYDPLRMSVHPIHCMILHLYPTNRELRSLSCFQWPLRLRRSFLIGIAAFYHVASIFRRDRKLRRRRRPARAANGSSAQLRRRRRPDMNDLCSVTSPPSYKLPPTATPTDRPKKGESKIAAAAVKGNDSHERGRERQREREREREREMEGGGIEPCFLFIGID